MEKEVLLPIGSIEKPKDWFPLHKNFTEALSIIQESTSLNPEKFAMTCIHLHGSWIEGCDIYQAARYRMKNQFTSPCLVKKKAIAHITTLDMVEVAETAHFVHFRNPTGLIFSCRRYLEGYIEDFPDLGPVLEVTGTSLTLPKIILKATKKAEVFSKLNDDKHNQVSIELQPGKLRLRGMGTTGWYSTVIDVAYEGKATKFLIPPKLLRELISRHNECEIGEDRLKVAAGKLTYISCLTPPEEKSNGKES